jgi:hypothetical protein
VPAKRESVCIEPAAITFSMASAAAPTGRAAFQKLDKLSQPDVARPNPEVPQLGRVNLPSDCLFDDYIVLDAVDECGQCQLTIRDRKA